MPGIEGVAPTSEQMAWMREKFKEHLDENGQENYEADDIRRVMEDDLYLARFFKHVWDEPGEQTELGVTMIINALQWRKTMAVKGMTAETLKQSIKDRGNLYMHNKDKDGKMLLVLAVKNHKRGEESMDDMKRVFLYYMERIDRLTNGGQMSLVFDCAGCGLKNMDMELIQYMIKVFSDYYPDVLNYILVFEMPWVLNAAWKVIKSWLPAAGVKKIKFLTKSNLYEYVAEDQALVAWGGTDPWEYSWEEEVFAETETPPPPYTKMNGEVSAEAASPEWPPANSETADQDVKTKAVRFDSANESFTSTLDETTLGTSPKTRASSGGTMSSGFSDAASPTASFGGGGGPFAARGDILSLTPSSEVVFEVNAATNSLVAKVKIANTSAKIVVFKIKTTSPEKYRVRPSLSHLRPGETTDVEIHLHPSQLSVEPSGLGEAAANGNGDLTSVLTTEASASLLKDKFLITGVTIKDSDSPDSASNGAETDTEQLGHARLTELMKASPPEVQYRLKCGLSGLSKASSQLIRSSSVGEKMPTTSTLQNANKQLETLSRKVASMQGVVSELQEAVISFKKLCVILVAVMLLTQMVLLYYISVLNGSLGSLSPASEAAGWPTNAYQTQTDEAIVPRGQDSSSRSEL